MAKNPPTTLGTPSAPAPKFKGMRAPITDFDAVRDRLQSRPFYVDIDLSVPRSLAAGTALAVPVNGNSIVADQSPNSGYSTIYFQDENSAGNTPVSMYPGAVFKVPFTFFLVENVAQPGLTQRLIFGVDIDFTPALSAGLFGAINVVDGGLLITKASRAFVATSSQPAVAAAFSHCQLWNPPGSGKNLIVSSVAFFTTTQGVQLRWGSAPLLNPYVVLNPENKLINGAGPLSSAENRIEANAAIIGTFLSAYVSLTSTFVKDVFEQPFVVSPGQGLLLNGTTVNLGLTTNFQFTEEDV